MFWYSSNVTLESKVFLRATLILRLGVRAWVAAAISAKAVKRIVTVVRCAFTVRLLCVYCVFRITRAAPNYCARDPEELYACGGLELG